MGLNYLSWGNHINVQKINLVLSSLVEVIQKVSSPECKI